MHKIKKKVKINDSWQHCCRYCKHYKNGVCFNKRNNALLSEDIRSKDWFIAACEEGVLQDALEEKLQEVKMYSGFFDDITKNAVNNGMGNKERILKDFKNGLKDCYDVFISDILPYLDSAICSAMDNFFESYYNKLGNSEIQVDNPDEYICKYWE